ncbi:hypothetical protein [Pseudoxanthomonas sp. PXM04]|uniref:hypothetical protein n=1 Tax=Pseudoxanthomonas sp. PXM04 TaxID=2769297 RepID=UPI001781AE5C|nr:hypothetical protein [Pseudoxanthomonas sp. PXM04]MBD9378662.1 hypothetical protein [Pseudoxanthomonas sp. PXM04]
MHPYSRSETAHQEGVDAMPEESIASNENSLSQLLHLLQGAHEPVLADVGITRFPPARLEALHGNASREAETCLDRAQLMLHLMEGALEGEHPPEPALLQRLAQQIGRTLADHRRWRDLADNAAYYRDHPGVKARISAQL